MLALISLKKLNQRKQKKKRMKDKPKTKNGADTYFYITLPFDLILFLLNNLSSRN
jgi:hypothetical protein